MPSWTGTCCSLGEHKGVQWPLRELQRAVVERRCTLFDDRERGFNAGCR